MDSSITRKRLAVVASHPIQYQAPLFRTLATRLDLTVFFAHSATYADQARAGFGVGFEWDVDLLTGYEHVFLRNVSREPRLDHFTGCDTPEIAEWLTGGRYDAVLVQGWHLKAFLQAAFVAKRSGLPLLVRGDSHLGTPRSALKKVAKAAVYPWFLRVFDGALYVGEHSYAYWRHYGYPSTRLFFSPHCVDTEWFGARATAEARAALRTRLGIAPRTAVVLFAGKLVPFKRPLDIVAAAALMKARGREIVILVAGTGPLEGEMAEAARAAGVVFHGLGFCNQSEMPAAYAAAEVLVLPSSGRETWGLVANEALACGIPIAVSNTAGCAPDLGADRTVGRVFPVGNAEALANSIAELLDRPPSPEAMTTKSEFYSLAAAADGIVLATVFVSNRSKKRVA